MPSHPVCEIPFEPNTENYKNEAEHDSNLRKHWYLVLGVGLFTKRSDAEGRAALHDVLIFFKKSHAPRRWKRRCMRRHTADDHSNPHGCTDQDDGEDDEDAAERVADAPPRAHSAALSAPRSTRPVGRAASAVGRAAIAARPDAGHGSRFYHIARDTSDRWAKTRLRDGVQSVAPAATGSLAQTSSAPKRCRETSVSWKCEPVRSKRDTPVPKTPLFADMSDSELTDTLSQKDNHINDDMPPLLYSVKANQEDIDMWMPPPSPPPSPAVRSPSVLRIAPSERDHHSPHIRIVSPAILGSLLHIVTRIRPIRHDPRVRDLLHPMNRRSSYRALRSSLLGVHQTGYDRSPGAWTMFPRFRSRTLSHTGWTYRVPDADPSDEAEDIPTQPFPHFT
ncbi:hypothetical protein B0H14DRAFT_3514029 [Mycena olivaceomarginata]|nr:hypothetical protein B0H14DRAFT_3514029 [Mycena olivaceomarginata]